MAGKIQFKHHTDYYLNTITDHYVRDQFGNSRFSHRTETGYIFQRRETKTEEKSLPPEMQKQLTDAIAAKEKQLELLRLSLAVLDEMEKQIKAKQAEVLATKGSTDDVIIDIEALKSAFDSDLLLSPRVYETLRTHNSATTSLLEFFVGNKAINRRLEEVTPQNSVVSALSKSPSFCDLQHVKNVGSLAGGLSFQSVASYLTLWRYRMETLAAENPEAYKALLAAWDARVKAGMTVGAVNAIAAAPSTSGGSLVGYGVSLGAGVALDYLADLVAKYGAKKAAAMAASGDGSGEKLSSRVLKSYEKTFDFVAAMVAQHGIRKAWNKAKLQKDQSKNTPSSKVEVPKKTPKTVSTPPTMQKNMLAKDSNGSGNKAPTRNDIIHEPEMIRMANELPGEWKGAFKLIQKNDRIPLGEGLSPKLYSKQVLFKDPKSGQMFRVIQRNDIDPNYVVHIRGRFPETNLERMKRGAAPYTSENKPVILHHMGQDSKGPLAEVIESVHKGPFHNQFGVNQPHPTSPVVRADFDKTRVRYWKSYAKQFE